MGDRSAARVAGSRVRAPLTQGWLGFALGFILLPTSWAQEQPRIIYSKKFFHNLAQPGSIVPQPTAKGNW